MRVNEFILNFVFNAAWQILMIFVVATLVSWLLRNGPARYRHTLWVVAMIASLIVPLFAISRFRIDPPSTQVVTHVSQPSLPGEFEDVTINHIAPSRHKTLNLRTLDILLLTFIYLLFISGRSVRLVRFWRRQQKLRQSVTDAPEIEAIVQRCRGLMETSHVSIGFSKQARVPSTIGALRPLIVLPEAFCTSADEAKLLSVIGHEMAHVKRRDFLSNLICELVALPISFHPLTFLIKRQIDRARELACDELVTRHVLAPNLYARSLLWAANVSREYPSEAFVLSIFDGRILEERIVRVMRSNRRLAVGPARVLMFAALSVLCVSALSLSMFSLELQTARAAVTESLQSINLPAVQEPVYLNSRLN